jgi:hypothetical protein
VNNSPGILRFIRKPAFIFFMRTTFMLFLLANLAWTTLSPAQIFATIEECDKTYGPPTAPTAKTNDVRFYKNDGLAIKILFVENKAAVITYTSITSFKITDEKQLKLLSISASGGTWEEVEGEGAKTWRRSDGQAFAIFDNTNGELNIFSTEYIEKSKAEVLDAINKR